MESQQAAFERFNRDAAAGKFKGSGNSKRHEGRNADSTSGGDEPRPDLYSIHQGKVVRIEDFGAFIQIPGFRKHGLVHKTQASKHFTEHISDVVAIGDHVWVKVTSLQDDKIALSMKYVSQGNGTDLDPNLIQLTEAEDKRKVHTGFVDKGPISIEDGGILRKTVCKKCGASGHLAVDCFSGGEKFDLLADDDGEAYELDTRSGSSKKEKKSKDRHKDKKDKDNHKDRDKDRHRHRDRDRESTRDRRDRQESSSHRKEKRRDRSRSSSPKRGAEPRGSKVESLSDALAVMRAHKQRRTRRSESEDSEDDRRDRRRSDHRRRPSRSRSRSRSYSRSPRRGEDRHDTRGRHDRGHHR